MSHSPAPIESRPEIEDDEDDNIYDHDDENIYGREEFADPTGHSALRASSASNPRRALAILLFLSACSASAPEPVARINAAVNAHEYIPGQYICKQFVDEKYRRLVAAGIAPASMTVLYGYTYDELEHVVLEVRWQNESYVLDNRFDRIEPRPALSVLARISPASQDWQLVLTGPHTEK